MDLQGVRLVHVACLTWCRTSDSLLWDLTAVSPGPLAWCLAIGFEGRVMGRARGIEECLEPTGSPDSLRSPSRDQIWRAIASQRPPLPPPSLVTLAMAGMDVAPFSPLPYSHVSQVATGRAEAKERSWCKGKCWETGPGTLLCVHLARWFPR